jgi:hypothetical protein
VAPALHLPQHMRQQQAFELVDQREGYVRAERESERATRRPAATTILPPSATRYFPEGSLDRFDALQSTFTIRVLHLERIADELAGTSARAMVIAYVRTARKLAKLLPCVLAAAPANAESPDSSLVEALRWAYLWAIEQVESADGMLSGSPDAELSNAIPREAISIFHEMACRMSWSSKPRDTRDASRCEILYALDETLFRMMQMQDWIAEAARGRRSSFGPSR